MLVPRISISLADQNEERAIMCLKGMDSYPDCSHCTLQSRLPYREPHTGPEITSYDEEVVLGIVDGIQKGI